MNTVILKKSKAENWDPISYFKQNGGDAIYEFNQYNLAIGDAWISVIEDDSVYFEFDDDEIGKVKSIIEKPVFYIIEWKGDEILENFMGHIPNGTTALVDDDHGSILTADAFLKKLKNREEN